MKKNDIIEHTIKTIFKIKDQMPTEINNNSLSYLKYDKDNKKEILRLIKEITKEQDIIILHICNINMPVLYRNFPLIDSNEFYMPFYVEGSNFNPLEARNGIVLNGIDSGNQESKENICILEEVYNPFLDFSTLILKKYDIIKNAFLG